MSIDNTEHIKPSLMDELSEEENCEQLGVKPSLMDAEQKVAEYSYQLPYNQTLWKNWSQESINKMHEDDWRRNIVVPSAKEVGFVVLDVSCERQMLEHLQFVADECNKDYNKKLEKLGVENPNSKWTDLHSLLDSALSIGIKHILHGGNEDEFNPMEGSDNYLKHDLERNYNISS